MKITDAHTHFYPAHVAANPVGWALDKGEKYWALLVGPRPDGKKSLQGFPSEQKFLGDMDAAGIERAIIQGWYWENHSTCALMNAEISKFVKKHPDRLSAFAAIQPAFAKESLAVIESARDNGFCGIGEIHDGVQNFSYEADSFAEVAEAAARLALPVCVHLTERTQRQYHGKCETNTASAINAARRFPKLNFIFAHWCGNEIFDNPDILNGLSNAYFDSAASPLVCGASAWTEGCSQKFASRAVFGTDYPLRLYPRKSKVEEFETIAMEAISNVPQSAQEDFFYNNIRTLISL